MVIVIIAVIVVVFLLVKAKKSETKEQHPVVNQQSQAVNGPTPGVNRCPADALINSPYYSKYKNVFGLVWYDGKQPKYKIDWLLQSLNMGRELENSGTFVLNSIKEGLPYFCETEREFNQFFNSDKPVMRGSVDGVKDMCFFYSEANTGFSHPAKRQYWQQRFREMISAGNLEAQGAACRGRLAFSDNEVEEYKKRYESSLRSLAEAGNAQAQLAVGKYLSDPPESYEWLTKAGKQGLSNAWYALGHSYQYTIWDDAGEKLSDEKRSALMKQAAKCYYKGAEADNGVMAASCQYKVGGYCKDGDFGFPKDTEMAKYWYRKSLENGETSAKSSLDYLDRHSS